MELENLALELDAIYQGSGCSMLSVTDHLRDHHTQGLEQSYDGSAGMAYFDGFKVFFSPFGYEIVAQIKE